VAALGYIADSTEKSVARRSCPLMAIPYSWNWAGCAR